MLYILNNIIANPKGVFKTRKVLMTRKKYREQRRKVDATNMG
jgi:hypothetical protein